MRRTPRLSSDRSSTFSFEIGWKKLGHPVPELNFEFEAKSGSPQPAAIDPLFFVVQKRAAKRSLGPLAAENAELFWGEPFFPFGGAQVNSRRLNGTNKLALSIKNSDANHGLKLLRGGRPGAHPAHWLQIGRASPSQSKRIVREPTLTIVLAVYTNLTG